MAIRVLLIDDDSTSREGIAGYLQDVAGFDVTDYASGDEALTHLETAWREYTVVLLDFVLGPPMSGNQVLQEILVRCPRLPVIVFTGLDPTGGMQTLGQGAYAYMRRPLDYTQMIYIIQGLAEQGMILSQMARDVKEFLVSDICLVWRLDRREQCFRVTAWSGDLDEEYRQNVTLDAGDKKWPKFFARGEPVYLPDVTDPRIANRYHHQEAAEKRGWTSLVSMPLVHEERIIGLLDSYTYKPLRFVDLSAQRRTMGMLRAFARQAAASVRFADLSRRTQALQEISQTLADTMEEKTLLRQILYKALELVGTDMGWLYIVDANTGNLVLRDSLGAPEGLLDGERELGEGITGWVAKQGAAFNAPEVSQISFHKQMPGLEVNSEIAVPLRRGEQTIGVLTAQSRFLNNFTNDDVDLLTSLAAQAAVVIERAKLARHLQEVSHLAVVGEFSEIAKYVVEAVRDLTGAEVNLWMMSDREEEGDNFLRIVASKGDVSKDFVQNARLPTEPGGSINAQALEERRPIVIDDIFSEHEGVRFSYIEEARQHGWHSFMAVPLFGRDDECLGTLSLYGKVAAKFGKSDMELVQTFANQAAIAFQQQNRTIALQQLAQVGQTLTESMTDQPKHLLQQVAGVARTLTGADCTVIYPYDLVKKRFFAKEGIASVGVRQPLSVITDKPRPKGLAALIQRVGAIVVHDIDKGEVQVGLGAVKEPDVDDGDIIQIIRSAKFVQRESIKAFVGVSLRVVEKGNGKQSKSQEVGILYVDFRAPHHFTQEELQIITIYAHQVANVIRGSRLYTEAQKQATELAAAYETALNIVAPEDVSTRLEVIVKAATELLKGKGGKIYLRVPDQDELELVAVKGIDSAILKLGDRIPFGEGMAGRVIQSKKPLIVDDYSTWPGGVERLSPLFTAVIEVPLLLEEEAIGVIAVFDDVKKRKFTEDDVPVLQRLAQQAALAIHNASILAENQSRLELLDALHETSLDIVQHLDLDKLMKAIIERAANLMAGEHHKGIGAAYWRCDYEAQKAVIEHSPNPAFEGIKVDFDEGLIGEVMRTGKAQYKNDFPDWEHRESVFDRDNLVALIRHVIAVPVKENGKVVGIIAVTDASDRRRFSEDDSELLERFAHLASIAIQNASLVKQERALRQQAEMLREVSNAISSNLKMEDVSNRVLDELAKVIAFRKATIQLIREGKRTLLAFRGFGKEAVDDWLLRPISQDPLVNRIVTSKKPLILSDSRKDPDWEIRPWTADVRSWVGLPFVYGGETLGLLTLDHDQIGFYNQAHTDLLVLFGSQAAIAIQNSRLFEDAQRRIRDLEMLNNIVQIISTEFDTELSQLLQAIVTQIAESLNCTHCTIFLSQEENGALVLVPQVSWGPFSERAMSRRFRPGEGLAGWVFEYGESVMLVDAREDDRFSPARTKENPPRSMLVAPVQIREQTIGVICADQDKYGWFDKSDQPLLDGLARHIGIAIERDRLRKAQIDAVRREYVLDVAHQLIGPLSGLRAHTENLLEGRLTVERGRTVLKTLVEQAGLLQRYAENFAYAARSSHSIFSSTEFRPRRHDSRRLVNLLIKYTKSFQGQAKAKNIRGPSVDEVSFRGFPTLMLDENLFETLMLNLYDNAVKYSYETAPIIIAGRVLDAEVEIEVTNHGIPLYPKDISLILQRYYRSKEAEEHAVLGTGIGLFICEQIVKLHGGTIRALPSKRSLYGNEVKFVITLPIAKI